MTSQEGTSTSPRQPRLLVVDDDPVMRRLVERFAEKHGFVVTAHEDGDAAIRHLAAFRTEVAIVDVQMPTVGGIDVLRAAREADPECHVVLITGSPTLDSAIEAVRLGAYDYLKKPLDFDRLEALLTSVVEGIARRQGLTHAEADVAGRFEFQGLIGISPAMQGIHASIRRLAPHVRTVLITGETGAGKDLVAKALHDVGPRRGRRFVTVNCSAIVENLFESELFGHMRGAFSGATDAKAGLFEHANGGTIFLDEVGELPSTVQAKLLRTVENGEVQRVGSVNTNHVDVVVVAATNRDLRAEVEAGRFRQDLYYRLSVIELHLPPLRERREDVPYLTAAFLRQNAARMQREVMGLTQGAEQALRRAHWPGNVRELKNVVERACLTTDGHLLTERDVLEAMGPALAAPLPGAQDAPPAPEDTDRLDATQRELIERVLRQAGANKAEAARRLGVSRRALYRLIERLNVQPD